jgi:predicted CXXCH cytochrome family protein
MYRYTPSAPPIETPPSRGIPWRALLPFALLGGALLWSAGGLGVRGAAAREDAQTPKATYVGSDVCANCHQAEHALWSGSSHYHTFEKVNESNLPADVVAQREVSHPPRTTRYRKEGERYLAETEGPDGTPTAYHLSHVVGRMRVRMFIATLPNGRMQVLPAMLEEPTQKWFDYTHLIFGTGSTNWDEPPVVKAGDPSSWTGVVRSWDTRCAYCHVSGFEARRPDAQGNGPRYRARADRIDCESCHGPASEHVDFRESKAEGKDPIVRFRDLAHDRALSVCLQCHMESEVIDTHFRPGDDIFEFKTPTLIVDPERVDPSGRPLELIYDGLPINTSRCVMEGKLTCISCHDPHGSSNPSQLREDPQNDKLCARCHEEIAAAGSAHTHHAADGDGSRCVNCHMPFLHVERNHGVVADHSISTPRFDLVGDRLAETACTWCHTQQGLNAPAGAPKLPAAALEEAHARWWPDGAQARPWMQALGRARLGEENAHRGLLAVLDDTSNTRVVRASAAALLGRYAEQVPLALLARARDPDSLVRRMALESLAGLEGAIIDRALQTALSDPSRPVRVAAARTALLGWKRVQANAALLEAVLPILEADALERPDDDMRWFRLGAAYSIAGRDPDALAAYERVAELDPFADFVRAEIKRLREAGK